MKTFIVALLSSLLLVGCSQQTAIPSKSFSSPLTQTESQNALTEDETLSINAIKTFSDKKPLNKNYQSIQHVGHEPNPDTDIMLEKYDADGDIYLMQGGVISQFMDKAIVPKTVVASQTIPEDPSMGSEIYTQQKLEAIAKEFIKNNPSIDPPMGPKTYTQQELEVIVKEFFKNNLGDLIDLTNLAPNFSNKGGNYFFAWENRKNGKNSEGVYPRVQVGIRQDGWIFSYEDILDY